LLSLLSLTVKETLLREEKIIFRELPEQSKNDNHCHDVG